VKEMAEKVEESLGNMRTSDIVVVQILDSSSYMARTEEGGDLPICQFANGEFHVVGELVYAGKEKQLHLLKTILPILRLLENRRVIFMVPLLRYVVNACCADEEHLTNGGEPGFEERFRSELAESRKNYKDFLFCHGLRGFRVVDVNYVLPNNELDEEEERCWTTDPVHPSTQGYNRIVDVLETEFSKLKGGGRKRDRSSSEARGGRGGHPKKKPRVDTQARWVESTDGPVQRMDGGGSGRDWRPRGQFRGRPFRGRPYRGRGHYY